MLILVQPTFQNQIWKYIYKKIKSDSQVHWFVKLKNNNSN
jgi:hypothetical protein